MSLGSLAGQVQGSIISQRPGVNIYFKLHLKLLFSRKKIYLTHQDNK